MSSREKQPSQQEQPLHRTPPTPGQPLSPDATPPPRALKATTTLTTLSLIFVVLTPVIYFCGRAFHDGWYEALHLDPGMFPLDTASMLTNGAIAWGDVLSFSATALIGVIKRYPWQLPLLILGLSISWVLITKAGRWLDRRNAKWKAKRARPFLAKVAHFVVPLIKPTLVLTLGFLVIFEFVFGMTTVFGLIVLPFYRMGQHEAKTAVSKGFIQSPKVVMKNPTGSPVELKEIGCGPQFCGLWNKDHAVTVPISALTWSDSPKPER